MGNFSWAEMLVIGIVALIIVGPKDLPVLFRNVGRFVGKARGMAREFSSAMNQAADDAGVKDIQSTLKAATDPLGSAMDGVKDATKDLTNLNLDDDTGTETAKLRAEREESVKKIQAQAARNTAERKQRELDEALKEAAALEAEVAPTTKDG